MGSISYALFAYALTAVISLVVTAIIVLVSKLTGKSENEEGEE